MFKTRRLRERVKSLKIDANKSDPHVTSCVREKIPICAKPKAVAINDARVSIVKPDFFLAARVGESSRQQNVC
jgi:hypothetical protein